MYVLERKQQSVVTNTKLYPQVLSNIGKAKTCTGLETHECAVDATSYVLKMNLPSGTTIRRCQGKRKQVQNVKRSMAATLQPTGLFHIGCNLEKLSLQPDVRV
jgi:hypothetical protein